MTKPTETSTTPGNAPEKLQLIRKRTYTFPDIDGGGPAVTIEATSLDEATELFKKGHANRVK